MERAPINNNFDFTTIERILNNMNENHTAGSLNKLRYEVNRLFNKAKCKEIIYTNNTDKLFFGMRVYPDFNGNDAIEILGDSNNKIFESYVIELDSKLFDPMLCLNKKELTAILLHEIGHIVYDVGTIDEVRKAIDMYFAKGDDYISIRSSRGYKELIAYALKDAVFKTGSLFTKFGNTETIADTYAIACGYGPYLETAIKKLKTSSFYLGKEVDDRFIVLSWVLRLRSEFNIRRLPAIKTLNKAKTLTGSALEKREMEYASTILQRNDFAIEEGFIEDVRNRFSKKFTEFKNKGIRSMRNDIYELDVQLRTADTPDDLMRIIRTANTDVAILQDYLTQEDLSDDEVKRTVDTLKELYRIREIAAKEKKVKNRYDSAIQVIYPE